MWPFNRSNRQPAENVRPDLTTRMIWAEKVKGLVEDKARSTYPSHKPVVEAIGIEPPPSTEPEWTGAEEFVKGLEEHGSFEEICFRAFVGFISAKLGRVEFWKHIDVRRGKVGDFFWPPHEDWGATPLIYAFRQHVGRGATP